MRIIIAAAVLVIGGLANAAVEDVEGSADHPLIPRYEDSEIRAYEVDEFDEYELIGGPTRAQQTGVVPAPVVSEEPIPLDGKITHLLYRAPAERSALEVFRNYESALQDAGFQTLFSCSRDKCGYGFNRAMNPDVRYNALIYDDDQRYLAAKLSLAEGDVYVSLYVTTFSPDNRTFMQLDVIELKPMEERMVVVEASDMERGLAADGRVAIYGIHFDFDKDTLRPDSKSQLDEIGKLLSGNPSLKVMIVGHTDSQGSIEYNLDLSQRRANRVAEALARDYGIDSARMTPMGVGMSSPVANNDTEEGRALNRRVELVRR